jgi:hypothetical protein
MINWFFFLCRWHNNNLYKEKRESNAILWKITNKEIWYENSEWIEVIFRNKDHLKSSKSQNLIVSKLIHQQDSDKISFEKDEMFEDVIC